MLIDADRVVMVSKINQIQQVCQLFPLVYCLGTTKHEHFWDIRKVGLFWLTIPPVTYCSWSCDLGFDKLIRLRALDCSRGIAALIVLLYHIPIVYQIQPTPGWYFQLLLFPTKFGEQAVYFFMMLSGYVLMLAFESNANLQTFGKWIAWRLTRLLPVYYLALLVALVLNNNDKLSIQYVNHSYLFHNNTIYNGANPPLWSLTVEIIISIALLPLFGLKNGKALVVYVLTSTLLFACSYLFESWGIKAILRSGSLFLLGSLIYKFRNSFPTIPKLLVYIVFSLWMLLFIFNKPLLNITMAINFSLLLIYLLQTPGFLINNKVTLFLGKYSFSLYATHWVFLNYLSTHSTSNISVSEIYFTSIFVSLLGSVVFAHLVEFPFRKLAKNIWRPRLA